MPGAIPMALTMSSTCSPSSQGEVAVEPGVVQAPLNPLTNTFLIRTFEVIPVFEK